MKSRFQPRPCSPRLLTKEIREITVHRPGSASTRKVRHDGTAQLHSPSVSARTCSSSSSFLSHTRLERETSNSSSLYLPSPPPLLFVDTLFFFPFPFPPFPFDKLWRARSLVDWESSLVSILQSVLLLVKSNPVFDLDDLTQFDCLLAQTANPSFPPSTGALLIPGRSRSTSLIPLLPVTRATVWGNHLELYSDDSKTLRFWFSVALEPVSLGELLRERKKID